jgi:hypothetical protein
LRGDDQINVDIWLNRNCALSGPGPVSGVSKLDQSLWHLAMLICESLQIPVLRKIESLPRTKEWQPQVGIRSMRRRVIVFHGGDDDCETRKMVSHLRPFHGCRTDVVWPAGSNWRMLPHAGRVLFSVFNRPAGRTT